MPADKPVFKLPAGLTQREIKRSREMAAESAKALARIKLPFPKLSKEMAETVARIGETGRPQFEGLLEEAQRVGRLNVELPKIELPKVDFLKGSLVSDFPIHNIESTEAIRLGHVVNQTRALVQEAVIQRKLLEGQGELQAASVKALLTISDDQRSTAEVLQAILGNLRVTSLWLIGIGLLSLWAVVATLILGVLALT